MTRSLMLVIGVLLLGSITHGLKCSEQESVARNVLCYYEGRTSLENINFCNCTHMILTNFVRVGNNYTLDTVEDAKRDLEIIKERKHSLNKIFTFNANEYNFLESESKSLHVINEISNLLNNFDLNGVEVNFPLTAQDTTSKDSVTSFIKTLKKKIDSSSRVRVKRAGYDVSENVQDDITTAPYRTPTTKTARGSDKYQTTKKSPGKRRKNHRSRYGRRDHDEEETGKEEKTETRLRRTRKELRENHGYEPSKSLLVVRLPVQPETIAKKFDLKALSRYADLVVVSTHNITDESESRLTYHPSRLMGLSDMLNADSILDFLSGLGVEKSKIVLTLPATILKFQLEDDKKTTPRSPRSGQPEIIDQSELCSLFSNGNWTVERDDDLTAPYAFYDKTWLAYDDKISVNIKAKYILLRELAGGGVYPVDADTGRDPCNDTSTDVGYLVNTLHENFMKLDRKPRGLVLESLKQDIHDTVYSSIDAGVHLSEYRIVRVVDHSGAVHVIRKNTKTQFECSRQGYFSHPLGCNKFYRCVKFNQYTDDFTVFEYDCPAGLAFDERWEVCVWPGSLPHGAPCTGSSEIAPVPRSHYECPRSEGYYADPENCRWFFACLDHARDGVTPLTAYEFRCPFGLVFNEQNLACDWPWNVGACGNRGFSGVIVEHHGGSSSSLQSATFVNAGGFGSGFSASTGHQQGASAESGLFGASVTAGQAGSGYIAGHFEDNLNRASFATVPDYEISGGRILNHGGLILNHNVNYHTVSGDANDLNRKQGSFSHSQSSRSGAYDSAYVNQATVAPIVHTPTPAPTVTKLDQFVYDPPLSSPRPFSVRVPEVQINQEVHSSGASFTGSSTTPRVETFAFANGAKSGSINSFSVSSESGEDTAFVHQNSEFGQKINSGFASDNAQKQFEIHLPTQPHVLHSQTVHSGLEKVSQISTNAGHYDSNGGSIPIDASKFTLAPKTIHQSNVHFASANIGNNYRVSSTTPEPSVIAHENFGVSDAGVFVTPRPAVNLYHAGGIKYQSGIFGASNSSETFIHRPSIEVSTVTPLSVHGFGASGQSGVSSFSGSAAGSLHESRFDSKSNGKAILLEEHVERVVIPKVFSTAAPSVSYAQPSVSIQLGSVSSTAKTAATPESTIVTVEPQNFIGPIETSSPIPPPHRSSIVQHSFVSTPAPHVLKAAEPLVPVQPNFNQYRASVQTQLLHSGVSTAAPIENFRKSEFAAGSFGDRTSNQITLLKGVSQAPQTPAVQFPQIVLSTPSPSVYKAPEYLPPVQSKITVQQNTQNFVQPAVQSKVVTPVISSPAVSVYRKPEFVSSSVGFDRGIVKDITVLKPVVPIQKVSTAAPFVFSKSQFAEDGLAVQHGYDSLRVVKPAVQQFQQVSPAPQVFKAPAYLPPVQTLSSFQQSEHKLSQSPVIQTQFVKPVISTPAPVVSVRPEYTGSSVVIGQGNVQLKSSVQQNVQTYSQTPVVQEVKIVNPVASTSAPNVYRAPEYLPPVNINQQHQTVGHVAAEQERTQVRPLQPSIQTYSQTPLVQEVKIVQPTVSTVAPQIIRKPEYSVAVEQGNVHVKSSIQQNVHTYSQVPVVHDTKFVQPVVSTPAPAVFKAPAYLPPVKANEFRPVVQSKVLQPVVNTPVPAVFRKPEFIATGLAVQQGNVQQNIQSYTPAPAVQEVKIVQPVVSTPAPAVYKAPEYLPPVKANEFRPVVQSKVLQPVVNTPVPAVFRKPEFIATGLAVQQGNVQQNIQSYTPAPAVQEVKIVQPVVSTPAPTVYKAPEYLPPVQVKEYRPIAQSTLVTSTPTTTTYSKPQSITSSVTVEQGRFDGGGIAVLKPVAQQVHLASPAPNVYKAPEYLPPVIEQSAQLKSTVEENTQIHLQKPDVKFVQPVVSTPGPAVVSIQPNQGLRFVQQPIRPVSYNFVSSTTSGPVAYEEKEISETVSFPPSGYQQEIYRTRAKAKQLFNTVVQPHASVHYQQPRPRVTTQATYGLKSSSPSPAHVFGYQSISTPLLEVSTPKPEILETPITPKPAVVIQQIRDEKLSLPIAVTQNTIEIERSTSKPYIYEEYVTVSSPTLEEVKLQTPDRLQQPIIVTESPKQNILQQVLLQPQTLQNNERQNSAYFGTVEKSNPVVTVLEKEVIQPIVQQETFRVSSEPSVVIDEEEPVDYLPPTGQEIENYSNFEIQKIGKATVGFNVEDASVYNAHAHRQESGRDNQVTYKVNSNIEIAPPPEEYLLELTPKTVTTTAAPLQTTTVYRPRARPTTSTAKYTYDESYDTDSQRNKATVISVGQVDDEELEDGNVESLLEKYSGNFGSVLGREKFVTKVVEGEDRGNIVLGSDADSSTVGYDVSTSRSRTRGKFKSVQITEENGKSDDSTVASLDLKNLKLKKNKKTVIIVSQVSDANPLLIGKLAGQCSCQSNKLQFRKKVARLRSRTTTTTTDVPLLSGNEVTSENVVDSLAIEAATPKTSSENVILIDGSRSAGKSHERKTGRVLFTPEEPRTVPIRKSKIGELSGNDLGQALFTPVSAAEIARTEDNGDARSKVAAGASFDRYGPGGLRGFDETLQGSVDCERPGLFRHPKYCNKFYACNYDPWKKRYTLHVFNCPIHLSYDSSISACNWPSKGPACSDDHLLL